jgi:hypothetical protein
MRIFFAALVASFCLAACDNTIKLAAPWKDIPVVYAIFDGSQPTQYVRLEKAFLDPEASAVTVAQIPDSLYYPESAVIVSMTNERSGKTVQLTRIDGDLAGIPRKSGIFANKPNWLYKAATSDLGGLLKGDKVRVEVRRNDSTLPTVVATTIIPDAMQITIPAQTPGELACPPSNINNFEWESDSNGVLFNTTVYIATRRLNSQNQVLSRDTVTWKVGENVERGNSSGANKFRSSTKSPAIGFYEALNKQLTPPGANEFRLFDRTRILVVGGGKEIREFQVSANAASGVSGAESIPVFTNVQNGLGLVTAINQSNVNQFQIKFSTIDSVKVHPLTKNLGFLN